MRFLGAYLIVFVIFQFGFQLSSGVDYSGSVFFKNACQNSSFIDVPGFYDANKPVATGMAVLCKSQHCFVLKPWDYPVKFNLELLISAGPTEVSIPVTCCISGDTNPGCPQDNNSCQAKCAYAYGTVYGRTENWFCAVDRTTTGVYNPYQAPFKNFCVCELCSCSQCNPTQANCKLWNLRPTTVQSCGINNDSYDNY